MTVPIPGTYAVPGDLANQQTVRGVVARVWRWIRSSADTYVGENFGPFFLGGLASGLIDLFVDGWAVAWGSCVFMWAVGFLVLFTVATRDLTAWLIRRAFRRA